MSLFNIAEEYEAMQSDLESARAEIDNLEDTMHALEGDLADCQAEARFADDEADCDSGEEC